MWDRALRVPAESGYFLCKEIVVACIDFQCIVFSEIKLIHTNRFRRV